MGCNASHPAFIPGTNGLTAAETPRSACRTVAGGSAGDGMLDMGRDAEHPCAKRERAPQERKRTLAYLAEVMPSVPYPETITPPALPTPYCGRHPNVGIGLGTACIKEESVGDKAHHEPLLLGSAGNAGRNGAGPQDPILAEGHQPFLQGKAQGRTKVSTDICAPSDNQAGAPAEARSEATGALAGGALARVEGSRSGPEPLVKPRTKSCTTKKAKPRASDFGKIPGLSTCTPSGVLALAEMSQPVAEPPSSFSCGGIRGKDDKPAADTLPSAGDAPQPDALHGAEPRADEPDQPMVRSCKAVALSSWQFATLPCPL